MTENEIKLEIVKIALDITAIKNRSPSEVFSAQAEELISIATPLMENTKAENYLEHLDKCLNCAAIFLDGPGDDYLQASCRLLVSTDCLLDQAFLRKLLHIFKKANAISNAFQQTAQNLNKKQHYLHEDPLFTLFLTVIGSYLGENNIPEEEMLEWDVEDLIMIQDELSDFASSVTHHVLSTIARLYIEIKEDHEDRPF